MDVALFTDQVRARERSLYRIAYSYLQSDADAADAVQDALLKAWEKRHTLRQPQFFGSWLTRILINRCKQMLRQRKPQYPLQEQHAVSQEDAVEDLALASALEQLDPKYRIPLLLFHLEGFSVKEIAGIMRLPQNTVKSRLARARQKLNDLLTQQEVFDHA